MGYLSREILEKMGFAELGANVQISDKASVYNPGKIKLGSHVRIDDFCIISAGEGGIEFGNYVHIACYVSLIGAELIRVGDYVGISSKSAVYSSSDDYSGNFLVGPTIPDQFKNVDNRPVIFETYSLIGAGTVVLPGVTVAEGTAVGALSLVTKNLDAWGIYIGSPIKFIKPRSKAMMDFVPDLLAQENRR
ncbi:acyltransferase [Flavobacterium caeni]|uniref:Galactoside O-acetyltransferase n=1 Tax=Flavobacterium caeni TaxID=490189 RepID=A0A1G5FM20_9FLAO|nr:acyltransferase [Flavobacterium caeni]SCY39618.1 galactoside O-acetyltransferase [Flavobacterium caeni]